MNQRTGNILLTVVGSAAALIVLGACAGRAHRNGGGQARDQHDLVDDIDHEHEHHHSRLLTDEHGADHEATSGRDCPAGRGGRGSRGG